MASFILWMEAISLPQEWVTTQIYVSGPPRLPVWGSYWFVLQQNFKYLHIGFYKLAQKYKSPIVGLYLGPIPAVVLNDYYSVRQALTRPELQGRVKIPVFHMRTYNKNLGTYISPTYR